MALLKCEGNFPGLLEPSRTLPAHTPLTPFFGQTLGSVRRENLRERSSVCASTLALLPGHRPASTSISRPSSACLTVKEANPCMAQPRLHTPTRPRAAEWGQHALPKPQMGCWWWTIPTQWPQRKEVGVGTGHACKVFHPGASQAVVTFSHFPTPASHF